MAVHCLESLPVAAVRLALRRQPGILNGSTPEAAGLRSLRVGRRSCDGKSESFGVARGVA